MWKTSIKKENTLGGSVISTPRAGFIRDLLVYNIEPK